MPTLAKPIVLVIGNESAGKSQLVSSLTGRRAYSSNFPGTTVACDQYDGGNQTFVDTPGIVRQSDSDATLATIDRLAADVVLIVTQATHLDDDLADLLPLAAGKRGAVVVTFWDKIDDGPAAREALARIERETGLLLVPVDARHLTPEDRERIAGALDDPAPIPDVPPRARAGWRLQPPPTFLDHPLIGPFAALAVLLLPAVLAVWTATTFAALLDPFVQSFSALGKGAIGGWPGPIAGVLVGSYGLLTMGPLLFVWAAPTVVLYAVLLGAFKASGLLDRLTVALHPLVRPFGLSGRDLVRVLMGFGCNVPAVLDTRLQRLFTRRLHFGDRLRFGLLLSVRRDPRRCCCRRPSELVIPYLAYLAVTTLIYLRLTTPSAARSPLNLLVIEGRSFLSVPRPAAIWREAQATLDGFFRTALPIFVAICIIAGLLDWLGILAAIATFAGPAMALFHLPPDAALPVVVSAIRKDGILLFASSGVDGSLTAGQLLTAVYLAGVLLPCLVTALTIGRERSSRFVVWLLGRQMLAAIGFTLVLGWTVALFGL